MSSAEFPRQQARTRRFTLGAPRNITVSPDGRRIVVVGDMVSAAAEDTTYIDSAWVREFSSREWTRVPESGGVWQVEFSPDSSSLFLLSQGEEVGSRNRLLRVPADLAIVVLAAVGLCALLGDGAAG